MKRTLRISVVFTLILAMLVLPVMSYAYELNNFGEQNYNNYNFTYNGGQIAGKLQFAQNGGAVSISEYVIDDTDSAAKLTYSKNASTGKDITEGNAPALQWIHDKVAANALELSYDFNVQDFAPQSTGEAVFGFSVRTSSGWMISHNSGTLLTDGSVRGSNSFTWATGKWYHMSWIADYTTHAWRVTITDKETGITYDIADGVDFSKDYKDITIINFEGYCPANVLIDNLSLDEAYVFGIYSPIEGTTTDNSLNAELYLPESAQNAALYVDGSLVSDELTPTDGLIVTPLTLTTLGDHTITLTADIDEKSFADEVAFKSTALKKSDVKTSTFGNSSEYYISQDTGGGVAGFSSRQYSWAKDTDRTNDQWSIFTYTAQDKGNDPIFVNSPNHVKNIGNDFYINAKIAAMQNNEKFEIALRNGTDIVVLEDTGLISGTNKEYEVSTSTSDYSLIKWIDIEVYVSDWNHYDLYVNGEYAKSGDFSPSVDSVGSVRLYMHGHNSSSATWMVTNLYSAKLNSLAAATTAGSVKSNVDNSTILADADAIKLSFDRAMNGDTLTVDTISVLSNDRDVNVKDVTSGENNSYLVSFDGELDMCAPLKITLAADVTDSNGISFGMPYIIQTETDTKSVTYITDITTNKTGTTVSGAVEVYWAPADESSCVFILAGYDDGELVDLRYEPTTTITHGKNIITVSKNGMLGTEFKAFLWDSIDTLVPVKY